MRITYFYGYKHRREGELAELDRELDALRGKFRGSAYLPFFSGSIIDPFDFWLQEMGFNI